MRSLIKDMAIYGSGDLLVRASIFITMPIYTRIFTPEEYGIWSFIVTAVGLVSGILILGGDSAYARFFFEAKTLREKQLVTSTWVGFLALWSSGIIFVSLLFTRYFSIVAFGEEQYALLFVLALATVPLNLINTMCGQVLRNQFQARLFTKLNILTSIMLIGFGLIGVVVLGLGLVGLIGGVLVGNAIMLPVWLWSARSMLLPAFSVRLLPRLLAFGIPLVPTSVAYWIFTVSDRIVLGKMSTLEQLGLYSIANAVIGILVLVNGALGQAWSPHAVRVYEEEPGIAPLFFGRVMTYILVGFGLVCVTISVFAHEILVVLASPAFYPAAVAVGPLALGIVAYASTQVTASGISLTKKTKYFAAFSWAAALLNLGLNLALVPMWGMVAASWTTAISYLFLTICYLITSQRLWPVAYESRRGLWTVGLTIGFTLVVPLLPDFTFAVAIAVKSMYCLTYIALLFGLGVLDRREWLAFSSLFREKFDIAVRAG